MAIWFISWFIVIFLASSSKSEQVESDTSSVSPCDCKQVNSWQELKNYIQQYQDEQKFSHNPHRSYLLLCPFDITKDNSGETITFTQSIHLQCKRSGEEKCVIRGQGSPCIKDAGCTEWIKISSDDVWLQGMVLMESPFDVIKIDPNLQGIKLIDMEFTGNSSPLRSSGSIVTVNDGTNIQIIGSNFTNNFGTALENRGAAYIFKSSFVNNEATPFFISSDLLETEYGNGVAGAILNGVGAQLILSDSSFQENYATSNGPAIWANDPGDVLDLGGNCAENNSARRGRIKCDGIYLESTRICEIFSPSECTS